MHASHSHQILSSNVYVDGGHGLPEHITRYSRGHILSMRVLSTIGKPTLHNVTMVHDAVHAQDHSAV